MGSIVIEIETDNAAFHDEDTMDWRESYAGRSEVARILRKLATQIEDVGISQTFPLFDVNGNHVGVVTR